MWIHLIKVIYFYLNNSKITIKDFKKISGGSLWASINIVQQKLPF